MDTVAVAGNTVFDVFTFLSDVYSKIPASVQVLIYFAFGGMVLIAILRGIWR